MGLLSQQSLVFISLFQSTDYSEWIVSFFARQTALRRPVINPSRTFDVRGREAGRQRHQTSIFSVAARLGFLASGKLTVTGCQGPMTVG